MLSSSEEAGNGAMMSLAGGIKLSSSADSAWPRARDCCGSADAAYELAASFEGDTRETMAVGAPSTGAAGPLGTMSMNPAFQQAPYRSALLGHAGGCIQRDHHATEDRGQAKALSLDCEPAICHLETTCNPALA